MHRTWAMIGSATGLRPVSRSLEPALWNRRFEQLLELRGPV